MTKDPPGMAVEELPTAEFNLGVPPASESLPYPPPSPPPPARPAEPIPTGEMVQLKSACDPKVVPPASDAQLPPAEDKNESPDMDTPSPWTDPPSLHTPTTQELFQKFTSTPPVLRSRPDDVSEASDSSPSVAQEGTKHRIQKKQVEGSKNLHEMPSYKSSADTIHGSSRTRTIPFHPPTTGLKHY